MLLDEGYCPVGDGIRLYYQRYGDGPLTILIPNAASWAADLEPLAPRHTRIYYDLRCRGRSDPPSDPAQIGMEQDLLDLQALRQTLGFEQIAILAAARLLTQLVFDSQNLPANAREFVGKARSVFVHGRHVRSPSTQTTFDHV